MPGFFSFNQTNKTYKMLQADLISTFSSIRMLPQALHPAQSNSLLFVKQ